MGVEGEVKVDVVVVVVAVVWQGHVRSFSSGINLSYASVVETSDGGDGDGGDGGVEGDCGGLWLDGWK